MLKLRGVCVLLSLVAACSAGASGQVLSYSTYVPITRGPLVSISVNATGDACASYINTPPNAPFAAAEKFGSDGSLIYDVSSLPGNVLVGAIDANGNCYFAGEGQITTTAGAFQSTPKNSNSIFVVKFDTGGNLSFGTYLGGSSPADTPTSIAVDSSGNVYVTGVTSANDFPTAHAYQPAIAGTSCLFISVLNPTGTGLIYSTYWGGSGAEAKPAIAVDTADNAYITGSTTSMNFPTVLPFQATASLPSGFVIKLGPAGVPIYSTYLGSTSGYQSSGVAIAADASGSAYVTGYAGPGFPVVNPILGTVTRSFPFVTKISGDGSSLLYSTYLDGAGSGIAVDAGGQAYVTGAGFNGSLVSPIQDKLDQYSTTYVGVLNSAGSGLTFSTYLGQGASATSIGIDSVPNIYVAGTAGGPTEDLGLFPILNAPNGTYIPDQYGNSVMQGFVSKISLSTGISLSHPDTVDFPQQYLAVGQSATGQALVANTSASGDVSITNIATTPGDFTETNNCSAALSAAMSCTVQITFRPAAGGTRTGTITITDSAPGSPHLIHLTGTGQVPVVSLSPTSLTFSAQAVGSSSTSQQVTLTNGGGASLTISNIGATGDFSETNNCGLGLGPGANCQILVIFSPSAAGTRTGVLSITDSAAGSPHTVSLSGQGSPSLGLGVPQGDSRTAVVTAGAPASYVLSIGGGGVSGTASLTCTGAPEGASCTLPSSMNVSGAAPATFNVSVSTTSRTMAFLGAGRSEWLLAMAIIGLAMLPWCSSTKKAASWCLPLAIISALLLVSCGGSSSNNGPQANGTPAGTYNLTITATMAATSQSTGLTLTVQ